MKNWLILLLFLSCSTLVFGQKKKSTDVEIIVFDDDDSSSKKKKKEKDYLSVILIKTNPISNIFGKQYIEIEKPLKDFITLEAGLGITFKRVTSDYFSIYSELLNDNCQSTIWSKGEDYCDDYRDFTIRNTKLGFIGSISPKFYFYSSAPEDGYISFVLKYSTRNYEVQKIEENSFSLERIKNEFESENSKSFDFSVRYGYQTIYSRMLTDFFIGIGIKNTTETRQDIGLSVNGFQAPVQSFKKQELLLEAGIKVGLHFNTK